MPNEHEMCSAAQLYGVELSDSNIAVQGEVSARPHSAASGGLSELVHLRTALRTCVGRSWAAGEMGTEKAS